MEQKIQSTLSNIVELFSESENIAVSFDIPDGDHQGAMALIENNTRLIYELFKDLNKYHAKCSRWDPLAMKVIRFIDDILANYPDFYMDLEHDQILISKEQQKCHNNSRNNLNSV